MPTDTSIYTWEQRIAARAPALRLILQVHADAASGQLNGILGNLSMSGCFVQTYGQVQPGERIKLWLFLPTERWQSFSGEVVYQFERLGFGLKFVDLQEEDKILLSFLIDYLNEHSANYTYILASSNETNSAASLHQAPKRERRLFPRSCPLNVYLNDKKSSDRNGTVENISMGGLYMRTENPWPEGASITLRLPVGAKNVIVVHAQVIHSHPGHGFGAQFQWLDDNDPNRIILACAVIDDTGTRR